jgi:hypothetical protein
MQDIQENFKTPTKQKFASLYTDCSLTPTTW